MELAAQEGGTGAADSPFLPNRWDKSTTAVCCATTLMETNTLLRRVRYTLHFHGLSLNSISRARALVLRLKQYGGGGGHCFVYHASVTHLDQNIKLSQDQIGWLSRGPVAEMLQPEQVSAMLRGLAAVGAHAQTLRLHVLFSGQQC